MKGGSETGDSLDPPLSVTFVSLSMLTRGRKARVAVRPEAAHAALPPPPLPCVMDVHSRLSPRERLLASAVSRAWRAAVCQPSLWASVDLTQEGAASDALLAAVVSKAAGQVRSVRLSLAYHDERAVHAVVAANAGALRHLKLRATCAAFEGDVWSMGDVHSVLRTARGLLSFETHVKCNF